MAAPLLRLSRALLVILVLILPAHAGTGRSMAGPDAGRSAASSLTAAEELLQGDWGAYYEGSSSRSLTISFQQRQFHAEGEGGDWYRGRVEVRDQAEPSELDFIIEDCACKYKGKTSQAIYRWEGERLVMAAPAPGEDRPAGFDASSGEMMELRRIGEASPGRSQD